MFVCAEDVGATLQQIQSISVRSTNKPITVLIVSSKQSFRLESFVVNICDGIRIGILNDNIDVETTTNHDEL